MTIKWIFLVLCLLFGNVTYSQKLENKLDSVSYALGIMMADNMKKQAIDTFSIEALVAALLSENSEEKPLFTKNQAMSILNNYLSARKIARDADLRKSQKDFLVENAEREKVMVLESGLQYEVLKPGIDSLSSPLPTDKVLAHYEGTLIDGTIIDSSYKRGEPLTLAVNGVIKGWQEALQLMKPGAKWKLYIPYDLGYGERGSRGVIPPFATLIFTLELLSIDN